MQNIKWHAAEALCSAKIAICDVVQYLHACLANLQIFRLALQVVAFMLAWSAAGSCSVARC